MIKYVNKNQTKIEEFLYPLPEKFDLNNRWVKLSKVLPWDKLNEIYEQEMCKDNGRPSIDARQVIGALIIKHKMVLSDEETIETIRENPYMQYFLGLESFKYEQIFTPSLFVAIRKRLGREHFEEMTSKLIEIAFPNKYKNPKPYRKRRSATDDESQSGCSAGGKSSNQTDDAGDYDSGNESCNTSAVRKPGKVADSVKPDNSEAENPANITSANDTVQNDTQEELTIEELISISSEIPRKGEILMDATVAEQSIKYPTDLNLLNESRIISETIIDELYAKKLIANKPRTYRRNAKKDYLSISKKSKLSTKQRRKANKKQLGYLKRNINNIEAILDMTEERSFPLSYKLQRQYWIIKEIYRQQLEMNIENKNKCDNRIVSISQPHVRPVLRGKSDKKTEFGAKLGVYMIDGFVRLLKISWDAYNESSDLKEIILTFYQETGYLPKRILADNIYGTRANRELMKRLGIEFGGKPLGRPKRETLENKAELQKEKQRRRRLYRKRIPIEGKFGQGKNGYNLNYIRAKLQDTSESWISGIFFLMNVVKISTKKINSIENIAKLSKYRIIIQKYLQKLELTEIFSKYFFILPPYKFSSF